MEVIDGIRIGIQIVTLDIWIIWLIFILVDIIIARKWSKEEDKKLNKQIELYNEFVEYQKQTDKKYKAIIELLNLKEE